MAVPRFSRQQLLDYYGQVIGDERVYLQDTQIAELLAPASGFENRYSKYQIIQMALMDNTRLKEMWERREVKR